MKVSLERWAHPAELLIYEADYSTFAHPSFDANEYANAVLAGEPYLAVAQAAPLTASLTATRTNFPKTPTAPVSSSAGQEDLSVALAKLNFGIDDVSKQLRGVVRVYDFLWHL